MLARDRAGRGDENKLGAGRQREGRRSAPHAREEGTGRMEGCRAGRRSGLASMGFHHGVLSSQWRRALRPQNRNFADWGRGAVPLLSLSAVSGATPEVRPVWGSGQWWFWGLLASIPCLWTPYPPALSIRDGCRRGRDAGLGSGHMGVTRRQAINRAMLLACRDDGLTVCDRDSGLRSDRPCRHRVMPASRGDCPVGYMDVSEFASLFVFCAHLHVSCAL